MHVVGGRKHQPRRVIFWGTPAGAENTNHGVFFCRTPAGAEIFTENFN